MLLLHTSETNGSIFIRTDQLDGETDWKLRKPVSITQQLSEEDILTNEGFVIAAPPSQEIYDFKGQYQAPQAEEYAGLSLENTLW
jgi:phospholipid-translocating ATPase